MSVTIPHASEMRAAGIENALAEAIRLINLNAAQGSVILNAYPKIVNDELSIRLKRAGYGVLVKGGARLVVSW